MKGWLLLLLVGIGVLTWSGCKKQANPKNKLDPRLKSLLESASSAVTTQTKLIPIFGATTRTIGDSLRRAIEATGAQIGTAGGKIFTADASPEAIKKLANMRQIKYLKLSEKAKPVK